MRDTRRAPGDGKGATMCEFVGWCALMTAPWVQAWGSIVGAMLGAGLAVVGAVWFESRKERARQMALQRVVIRSVNRIAAEAAHIQQELGRNANVNDVLAALSELKRREETLERYMPFGDLGTHGSSAMVIHLMDAVADVTRYFEILQPNRTAAYLTNADMKGMLAAQNKLIETADLARGFLGRHML